MTDELRVVRFAAAGLIATAAYVVFTYAFVFAGWEPVRASISSYLCSLVLSYALQSTFAFRVGSHTKAQVWRFLLTSAIGLPISYGAMWVCTTYLGRSYIEGMIAVCILIPTFNYAAFSLWVFRIRAAEPRNE